MQKADPTITPWELKQLFSLEALDARSERKMTLSV